MMHIIGTFSYFQLLPAEIAFITNNLISLKQSDWIYPQNNQPSINFCWNRIKHQNHFHKRQASRPHIKQTVSEDFKIIFYIWNSFRYQKLSFHFRFNNTSSGSLFICYMWIWNQSSSNRAVQKLAGNKNIQVKNGQLLISVNWIYLGQFICDSGFFNWFRTFGPISTTFVFKVYQNNGPLIMKNDL